METESPRCQELSCTAKQKPSYKCIHVVLGRNSSGWNNILTGRLCIFQGVGVFLRWFHGFLFCYLLAKGSTFPHLYTLSWWLICPLNPSQDKQQWASDNSCVVMMQIVVRCQCAAICKDFCSPGLCVMEVKLSLLLDLAHFSVVPQSPVMLYWGQAWEQWGTSPHRSSRFPILSTPSKLPTHPHSRSISVKILLKSGIIRIRLAGSSLLYALPPHLGVCCWQWASYASVHGPV